MGVINWLRSSNIYKAINFKLKYLNNSYKIEIKCYKNFTYNTNIIFNQVYLLNAKVRTVHNKMKYIFSITDLMSRIVQIFKRDLRQVKISAQEVELMEPVEP